MTVNNIIRGLQIIQNAKPPLHSDYHFRAEHDEIFVGSLDWPIPDKDKEELQERGWSPDEDADGWRAMV